jgi:nicotinamide-nucleotide amidase
VERAVSTAQAARRLLALARERGLKIATAESCTGGLVAGALTDIAGSSDVVERGFVTYSNAAKQGMLGVTALTLDRAGAVSRETAEEMAQGALAHSEADLAVAITGIAGPGGATQGKPVGLVHFAAAARGGKRIHRAKKFGDIGRRKVRQKSVDEALAMLESLAKQAPKTPG